MICGVFWAKTKSADIMDFWKWPFIQCVTQLLLNENIRQSFKSESAPCIKLLFFKRKSQSE